MNKYIKKIIAQYHINKRCGYGHGGCRGQAYHRLAMSAAKAIFGYCGINFYGWAINEIPVIDNTQVYIILINKATKQEVTLYFIGNTIMYGTYVCGHGVIDHATLKEALEHPTSYYD